MYKLIFLPLLVLSGILQAQNTPRRIVNYQPDKTELPDTTQQIVKGRQNHTDQLNKPYVILISADGFRYDLADKYHAGNLIRLRDSGVAADYMQSSFPSLTFPNHYSIATGEYPAHDGIVDNNFFDPARDGDLQNVQY